MLEPIKTYFLTLRTRHALEQNALVRTMPAYARAKSIGILFSSHYEGADAKAINHLFRRFRDEGKNVRALTHFPGERSNPFDFKFDFFSDKDLTLMGHLKSDAVEMFVNTEFDFLYCIFDQPFLPFEYILAQSKARFRVGIYQPDRTLSYELMINPVAGQSLDGVLNEMLTLTKRISESV